MQTDGTWFCCYECAEEAGYHLCANGDYDDDCYWDPWAEEYYNDNHEVITTDGQYFYTEENAENYGYVQCVDTCHWILVEDAFYEEASDDYYEKDADSVTTEGGKWFHNEEAAKENGYTENENGEWVEEAA